MKKAMCKKCALRIPILFNKQFALRTKKRGEVNYMNALIILVIVIFDLFMLINALSGRFENGDKTACVITIIFLPILGALLYLVIGRHQKI